MPLTDAACRTAKPAGKPRKLADEKGLNLLVNEYVLRRLEADLFPVIGAVPVNELMAPTLLAAVRRIEE